MAIERLEVEIDLQTGQVIGQLKKVEDQGKKASKGIEGSFNNALKSIRNNTIALFVAFKGLQRLASGITNVFRQSIQAASIQEDAINRLNSALSNAGSFSQAASLDIQRFASELQNVTKFGDEALLNQIALAKSFGATNEQAKLITRTATDLSAAFGIDLESATRNVSKTLGGYAGELGEVIPELKNFTQAQLQAGAGIDIIAQKFQGLAEGEIKTFSGSFTQLSNVFGDLLESIGRVITNSPALVAVFQVIKDELVILTKNLDTVSKGRDFLQPIIIEFFNFAKAVNNYVVQPTIFLGRVVNTIFEGVRVAAQGAIVFVTQLLGGLAEAFFQLTGLGKNVSDTLNDLSESALAVGRDRVKDLTDSVGELSLSFDETFNEDKNTKVTTFFDNIITKATEASGKLLEFKNQTKVNLDETTDKFVETANAINTAVNQGIVNGVSAAAVRLGASLRKGAAAFEGFGEQVLSIIGDMAINIGKTLIAIGTGIEALGASLKTLTGGAAIAAGVALVALGGLLKSFSSDSLSSAATSGASGASPVTVIPNPADVSPEIDPDSIDREKDTRVSLTVQGDVLDSDETGTRIVRLLNDAFENRGTVLTGAKFA